ncbi:DsbA family protein [Xanthobacteraceae bacterium Astr-EGSB]|uniref:DsbA family protein n=1 Tax=Astrobacterium formosum TaxID=3069710 RepID=UPI0027B6D682|nr:DsbA family protein [Xanthobacteraceae bacterium Astr-EGSB]
MKTSFALAMVLCVAMLAGNPAPASAQAGSEKSAALADAVIGRVDAPVTVIEYSSLGCPHCADVHSLILPSIKKQYIDTGKLRWIVRDFPLGQLALAGAVIARCAGPQGHLPLLEVLFKTQDDWMTGKDPIGSLGKLAKRAGIDKARFDSCFDDEATIGKIMAQARDVQRKDGVSATPTFFINGEKVVGSPPLGEFLKIIERHLNSAKTP